METVDWSLAERIGTRFAPKGPAVPVEEARELVAQLRLLALTAREPVAAVTGLHANPDLDCVSVVERSEWIRSNVTGFAVALAPLVESERDGIVPAVGSRLTAAQIGGALAWLSGKVLGQYEAFRPPGQPGRLLLVAPNILAVERELEVTARDFRLWVCLHEETHRVQFGAVPWLAEHFLGEVQAFVAGTPGSPGDFSARLGAALQAVVAAARGRSETSLMEAVQTPAQRVIFDRLTGLMSLLEGHADYVMDEVGPQYVPSVSVIRERFNARRGAASTVDGFARRVLGLQTKLRQYTQGLQFVQKVIAASGPTGFAQVWARPSNLPSAAEITDPATWLARVLQ